MSQQQPPPEAATPASGAESEPAYGGVGRRAVAIILDSFLGVVVFIAAGFLVGSVTGETTDAGFQLEGGSAVVAMGAVALIGLAYYVLLEAYYGQTLGKRLAGIRVVSEDRSEITLSEAVIRNVLRVVDAIGFYLVGLVFILSSDGRQRLGDRVGNTVVVSD